MYPSFFGFSKLPFRLRPDLEFLYASPGYTRAQGRVLQSLTGNSRLVVLSGPPGVGKTMLLEDVLSKLNGQFAVCRINQPQLSAAELLQAVLIQLGAGPVDQNSSAPELLTQLVAWIDSVGKGGRTPLLVLDDVHLLSADTLGNLADMLQRESRLRLVLAGQNGSGPAGLEGHVRAVANGLQPTQLRKAIPLGPLSQDDVKAYIERRLKVAGASGAEIFAPEALASVFRHTGGAPRLINVLCDAALHVACARASSQVSATDVLAATEDPRWPEAIARDRADPSATAAVERPASAQAASAHPKAPIAPTAAAGADTAAAHLVVSHGTVHIGSWPLSTGRISIGRAPDNELQLDARFISRHHCCIVTVDNVSTIADLDSVNGILINGKPARHHVLEHADQVTVGEHLLVYMAK